MQKLRLFSMDDGSILPIDQTIDSLLQNEALFNGGTVILERVTEDVKQKILLYCNIHVSLKIFIKLRLQSRLLSLFCSMN